MKFRIPESMRILCIGAHPDDCEISCSGMGALWREQGHSVTFLSVTNGQSGHHELAGSALVHVRTEEARRAAEIIGAESRVLPLPDGHLEPSLENRLLLIRVIREIAPHVIVTNRPNDYHPDHRYTSQMVQDAAYSLMVPNIAPEVEAMPFNPVILYWWDHFVFPGPFEPSIVISIDSVFDRKIEMMHQHTSQFYGWLAWVIGEMDSVPAGEEERKQWLRRFYRARYVPSVVDRYRDALRARYGEEGGERVVEAEAYSLCEYGSQASPDELEQIFAVDR
ncbi:MAG: PIG-L family deacetylase [Spirochaetaceae bacterium]|nr:MAG: PIG-L family deacetylase [Spirochaetaceae bacterium]